MKFPPSQNPFGGVMDIYSGNNFNPQQCWDDGIRLVIHKAGQWSDEDFDEQKNIYLERKAAWTKLGGSWGNYFLPYASSSSADMFIKWMECDGEDPYVMRAIDWEDDGSGNTAWQKKILELAQMFENHFEYPPVIYGSNKLTEMQPSSVLARCPGWYAQVGYDEQPTKFSPKHPPTNINYLAFHQWTMDGDAAVSSYDGADLNIFKGNFAALLAAFPFFKPPVDPPNGQT